MRRKVFSSATRETACLVLEDGSVWAGTGVGMRGFALGELCFNTAMSGYQEILSDPSYTDQIVVFSFPHIGNVGTNAEDEESSRVYARGCVFAQPPSEASSWRSEKDFSHWLKERNMIALYGVDTRSLVHLLRDQGAQRAAIIHEQKRFSLKACLKKIQAWPGLKDAELTRGVSCGKQHTWRDPLVEKGDEATEQEKETKSVHVVALDFGMKRNILRCLEQNGARITIVPSDTSSAMILGLRPDGIFLSNGPGDPAASALYAQRILEPLLSSRLPMFGLCLGFQLLAHALGGRSEKMSFGHHGANHPVQELSSGQVEITSQNHGFAVPKESLPDSVEATHVSLFDGTLEGFRVKKRPIFAVQYHPEASPGPHDSRHLFARFLEDCRRFQRTKETPSPETPSVG